MKKRKQSGSSDLRTNSISLQLHRYMNLPILRAGSASYWNIEHLQPFFPPIECLFKSETLDCFHEYGVKLKNEIVSITNGSTIRTQTGYEDIHIKKTMLLSPFKWMQGEYGTVLGLPTTADTSSSIQSKLQNPNNAAYVGSLISILLSETGCVHFPKVYGVFTGTSKSHTIDISDDYEELSDRPWFSQNIGKTFELRLSDKVKDSAEFQHTRTAKKPLFLGDDISLENVEELDTVHIETTMGDIKNVFEGDLQDDSSEGEESSVSTAYIFALHSCDCDEEDREILDEEDESGESFAWATFANVPVQLTVMEKCEGTLYELMTKNTEEEKHLAWLSQIIFALAYAQRTFGFVHNDLHSNNVMYVKTNKEFLYYNWSGFLYKIPTYGYIIKLIDFERGVTSVKLNGMKEPKFFMSDHFSVNDEAGGQYNYSPFYDGRFPEIKPNASFDLVRLATSLFWDFFPEGPSHEEYKKHPIFCLFMKWLTLEDGTSILFGKEDVRHDRFHGFALYKAIARLCKDTAVPRKELITLKPFYEVASVPLGESALTIDV